jgi:hypothetical protein
MSFGVVGTSQFLEKDLRKAGGSGLETDFGKLLGIVGAEEVQEIILVEAVLKDRFLLEAPFEVAASGPGRNVSFGDGKILVAKGGDNVFVRHGVPEHAVDHISLKPGEASDTAVAADFARGGRGGARRA